MEVTNLHLANMPQALVKLPNAWSVDHIHQQLGAGFFMLLAQWFFFESKFAL